MLGRTPHRDRYLLVRDCADLQALARTPGPSSAGRSKQEDSHFFFLVVAFGLRELTYW